MARERNPLRAFFCGVQSSKARTRAKNISTAHRARVGSARVDRKKIFASVSRFVLQVSAECVQIELNDLS
jgi:hypothetical protein